MIASLLFGLFAVLMVVGVPVAVALGAAGTLAIGLANTSTHWFGLMAVSQSFYAGLAKYPLLAIPMFVLVGSIFDRSGVAARLVRLAQSITGNGPGMLAVVAISVAMFLGGISGSGPACAAAVAALALITAAVDWANRPRTGVRSLAAAATWNVTAAMGVVKPSAPGAFAVNAYSPGRKPAGS